MTEPLNKYAATTANWRASLRKNHRRTFFVIGLFFLIYIALGILIDLYIYSGPNPEVPLSRIFMALITFQMVPYATLITAAVALISLWVTFAFHNKLILLGAEYHQVTADTARDHDEKQLYNVIEEMKVAAGLQFMPKVFIIEADYMNAFASGYSEKSAMVAITRGLMDKLTRDELQAVMAHELSHIRHMDIKLTLVATVLANIMLIVIDVMFWGVFFGRNKREGGGNWLVIVIIVLRFVLPLITVLLMLFLSRTREYMADAGAVELMRTNEPLARALLKIHNDHQDNKEQYAQDYAKTPHESVRREAYIFDPMRAGIEAKSAVSDFFSTHPGLKKRLAAIGFTLKSSG